MHPNANNHYYIPITKCCYSPKFLFLEFGEIIGKQSKFLIHIYSLYNLANK